MQAYENVTTQLQVEELGACALVQDLLPLFLEGEVSPSSRDLITEHLARCERCAGYMAGAQSVRVQLRRELAQRVASVQADEPRRGALLRWRELFAGMIAMMLCLPGGASAAAVGAGLDSGDPGTLLIGLIVATIISAMLLGLARLIGPLTRARVSSLFGGIALGGAGMILVMIFSGGGGSPIGVLTGFAVGVAGLVGVWSGVARDGQMPLFS